MYITQCNHQCGQRSTLCTYVSALVLRSAAAAATGYAPCHMAHATWPIPHATAWPFPLPVCLRGGLGFLGLLHLHWNALFVHCFGCCNNKLNYYNCWLSTLSLSLSLRVFSFCLLVVKCYVCMSLCVRVLSC